MEEEFSGAALSRIKDLEDEVVLLSMKLIDTLKESKLFNGKEARFISTTGFEALDEVTFKSDWDEKNQTVQLSVWLSWPVFNNKFQKF